MPDWTKEQKQAIEEKGSNLLVAAAAGSGKTAVLVERIIHKIIDEKIDIDKILVVTFTNAAASEMRERILDAIYKKIEENPSDMHLQRQITLLNKANICTIHSFCLDIIRNYFYEIDISANFQIGDSSEMELLKQEVLDNLFEEKYINKDKRFLKLIDLYANYRGDDDLKNIVLKIENQIQSNPFPELWLKEKVEMFNLKDSLDVDFSKTIWGEILLEETLAKLTENSLKLEQLAKNLNRFEELEKYEKIVWSDKDLTDNLIKIIQGKDENKWDKLCAESQVLKFKTWPTDKKITLEYKEEAKKTRDKVKDNIKDSLKRMKLFTSKEANEVLFEMYDVLDSIKDLILEFEEKFSEKKREKNKIDFHDIEHLALKILTKKEDEKIVPSDIALSLKEKFNEIAIDEYQDSNLVQEYILTSISNGNNIFMVGDIKQSIYRFRQARVELFSEKYDTYSKVDEKKSEGGRKIQLFKNFRSREEVLDVTNWVFKEIMSRKLGDVDYTEEEYLNLGADYEKEETDRFIPELHILDLNKNVEDEEELEYESNNEDEDENDETKENKKLEKLEIIEKNEEEAKVVADRIEELISDKFKVFDKKQGTREIKYKDIAILLRTTTDVAEIYEKELNSRNIPVYSDTSSNYLETIEIQTIISLLKIINNPMQDIPLVAVLRSPIGNFTDNDLIEIRLNDKYGFFYEAMLKARIAVSEELRNKINYFLDMLERFKELEREKPLDELIWQIYEETGYYNYVGLLNNGSLKKANLKMLFERAKQYETASFKGLYNFINFIDRLKLSSGDLSSAKIVGENDNVVRIMSIHKSKGLEFPVVFVSGTGKQFNKRDLNETIILHQDYGFGPKFIDSETKVSFSTLAKYALRIKLEREMISEEMRVLYVALTRAREKLIITGSMKNYAKEEKDLKDMLSLFKQKEGEELNTTLLRKYTSYLNWILLLCLKDKSQDKINVKVHKIESRKELNDTKSKEDIKDSEKEKIITDENKNILEEIKSQLNWKYKYLNSSVVPTKTSVSKLKEESQKELNLDDIINKKQEYIFDIPKFMVQKKELITNARKGTLMHLCFQRLDKKKEYTKEEIEKLINELAEKEIILKEEAKSININTILDYINSNLFKELKEAKEIHEEEPFYLEISANRLNKDYPENDKILVQGIIDLYYINKNDELILVDYKTDYVKKGEENKLIERYEEQLNLYKEAIEKSLNKKVSKMMIYSTWIGKIEMKQKKQGRV